MSTMPRPTAAAIVQQRAQRLLDAEEQGLRRVLRELHETEHDERAADGAAFGQHLADAASDMFEREVDLGLIEDYTAGLREVDAARRRLADGTYGVCEHCHRPIGASRLDAVPTARRCRTCAGDLEQTSARMHAWPRAERSGLIAGEFMATDDGVGDDDPGPDNAEDLAVTVHPL